MNGENNTENNNFKAPGNGAFFMFTGESLIILTAEIFKINLWNDMIR